MGTTGRRSVIGGRHDRIAERPVLGLVFLAHAVSGIAVDVRRLHDGDRSGWFALLGLVPLVGPVVLIIWFCQSGTPGLNRFGPDPLDAAAIIPSGASPIGATRAGHPSARLRNARRGRRGRAPRHLRATSSLSEPSSRR